jgi:hypothetical protein
MLFADETKSGLDPATIAGIITAVGLACAGIGATLAKLLPEWTKSRQAREADRLKAMTLEAKLKREAVHETRNEFEVILNRKEADILRRDQIIKEQGEKVDELYAKIHHDLAEHGRQINELMGEHTKCLVANEKLAARVTVLEMQLRREVIEHADPTQIDRGAVTQRWAREASGGTGNAVVTMPNPHGSGSIIAVPPGSKATVDHDSLHVEATDEHRPAEPPPEQH